MGRDMTYRMNFFNCAWLCFVCFISCQSNTRDESEMNQAIKTVWTDQQLVGAWIQPNPINNSEVQGFKLNSDGSASSVNMATLLYKNWLLEGDSLLVVVESVGNKVSSIDTIRYRISRCDQDTLVLTNGSREDVFGKRTAAD